MFKNYLKTAWRNIVQRKTFAFINITGLAIGMAAALLLFIVVRYELSYDRAQPGYNRIYRVVTQDKFSDGVTYNPGVPVPALEYLRARFPDLSFGAINATYQSAVNVPDEKGNETAFVENTGIFFCEPQFFNLFQTRWISGNASVLDAPNTVVLSSTVAKKYFKTAANSLGKTLKLDHNILLKVAGIIDDPPGNTDFPLQVLISMKTIKHAPGQYYYNENCWGCVSSNFQVYTKLPPGISEETINRQLAQFSKEQYRKENGGGGSTKINTLQPLSDLHFNLRYETLGDHRTSRTTLVTLSLIAVFILLMAGINFVNLATVQGITRSREMGVRKVLGGNRSQIFWQMMGETALLVLVAVIVAFLLAWVALPHIKHIASIQETLTLLNAANLGLLFAIGLLVAFLAGLYPALILSGFRPAAVFNQKVITLRSGGVSVRKVLVVFQFAITQVLMVGTIVAVTQMDFIRKADLGFNKDAILLLNGSTDSVSLARQEAFAGALKKVPGVQQFSFQSDAPTSDNNSSTNFAFDHRPDASFQVYLKFADTGYLNTYRMSLLAGTNYAASDTIRAGLINETLAGMLGIKNMKDAVGKTIKVGSGGWSVITGVVKDFKANSLKQEVKPMFIATQKRLYGQLGIKLHASNLNAAKDRVEEVWKRYYPEYAYNAVFLDDNIERFYQQDTQLSLLYKIFSGLAILIACLGLYGLVSFMVVQKTKEVGIRKVLGASAASLVLLLSKEFFILIGISFLLAVPAAWYMMHNWLENFVYRIPLHAGFFIAGVGMALIIAFLSVAYKAVRAAMADPVKSLRTE
ncbi:ABC transporter permease [Niabella drilacis]|uniref:Duplicated orphan permease n=1 Tax=Niabella drilacis (strain DSM 25811 / CCM 8410 / CCUG 62505 / LMG 26954 / E90) TaxID=1285928 RepID=A0A1G7AHW4_NIADE|nr:ABC transporter permease [Niabella drilacis]SDE14528.1 duplicated orphan permease [Niabella drilacis]